MKLRKLLLVFSLLTVMFSLAGCSTKKEAPFDYDETDIVVSTMTLFQNYKDVSDDYKEYYLESGTALEQSAVKGIDQAINNDKVGQFEDYSMFLNNYYSSMIDLSAIDYEIENGEDYVTCTIVNHAKNRDVEISVKYVENDKYYIEYEALTRGMTPESVSAQMQSYAEQNGISVEELFAQLGCSSVDEYIEQYVKQNITESPCTAEEMVVSPVYSTKELMGQAGMNTLLGMGTVFCVLIFISFIISLLKFLPKLFGKKNEAKEEKKESKAVAPLVVADDNLVDDSELVAVITAAIYASQGSCNVDSKDKLVVRSIRRVNR